MLITFHILVGVLMLNAVLTVRAGNANSHKDRGWEQLTDAVIQYLNKNSSNLVFMLWGSYAQKKGSHINQVCVLQCLLVHSALNVIFQDACLICHQIKMPNKSGGKTDMLINLRSPGEDVHSKMGVSGFSVSTTR